MHPPPHLDTSNTGSRLRAEEGYRATANSLPFPEKAGVGAQRAYPHEGADAHEGCRKLAEIFNRRFVGKESVGKTYVHGVIIKHQYEIAILRNNLKRKKPRPMPQNLVWGLDLTGKQDNQDKMHNILGIVEHASRANLALTGLKDKSSITLLRHLLDTIEKSGKPKMVRTDNESVFTSKLFRFGLWLLGIRHQKTDKGCPWMNGRIERFFRTLKEKLDLWEVDSLEQLNGAL
jgi:putative transposase